MERFYKEAGERLIEGVSLIGRWGSDDPPNLPPASSSSQPSPAALRRNTNNQYRNHNNSSLLLRVIVIMASEAHQDVAMGSPGPVSDEEPKYGGYSRFEIELEVRKEPHTYYLMK